MTSLPSEEGTTLKTKILTLSALLTCLTGLLQAAPLGTVFSYPGRLQAGGVDFTGSGLFKFALVTVTNTVVTAKAEANPPSGGFITVIVVTEGRTGYVTAPIVTITGGGGSDATATAAPTTPLLTTPLRPADMPKPVTEGRSFGGTPTAATLPRLTPIQ